MTPKCVVGQEEDTEGYNAAFQTQKRMVFLGVKFVSCILTSTSFKMKEIKIKFSVVKKKQTKKSAFQTQKKKHKK